MLTTPTPSTMVWNYSHYWGSFLSMNDSWTGCMSALGLLKQLGHFVPVWSSFLWIRPSLKHAGAGKSLLDIFCVHLRVPGTGEPGGLWSMRSHRDGHNWNDLAAAAAEYLGRTMVHFFRQNKSPSQKNTTVTFAHVIFVYMCGPWIGKGGRERDRECCVCKVSTHSHEIISDEEESEKDKYHMISLTCDICKNELLYKTDLHRMNLQLPVGIVSGGGYLASLVLTYTHGYIKNAWPKGPTG